MFLDTIILHAALVFVALHMLLFPWVVYGMYRQFAGWNKLASVWLTFGFIALVLGVIRMWPLIWSLQ